MRSIRVADPHLDGEVLVCPGGLAARGIGHVCSFVVIDKHWCWEHPERLEDTIERSTDGMVSTTLVTALDGMVVAQLTCRQSTAGHRLVRKRSWVIDRGQLVATGDEKFSASRRVTVPHR